MVKLAVFGGTGYAGSRIVAEAVSRGHQVIAVARNANSKDSRNGAMIRAGSLLDKDLVAEVSREADALVAAVPGDALLDALPTLTDVMRNGTPRLGVVGGASSLRISADGPRLIDTPEFPDEYKSAALAHARLLDAMSELPADVDWFYLSPPMNFGAHAPGERTGHYRLGSDVLLTDPNGESTIGGDDYAIAFLDEIDKPAHRRQRFTVAY